MRKTGEANYESWTFEQSKFDINIEIRKPVFLVLKSIVTLIQPLQPSLRRVRAMAGRLRLWFCGVIMFLRYSTALRSPWISNKEHRYMIYEVNIYFLVRTSLILISEALCIGDLCFAINCNAYSTTLWLLIYLITHTYYIRPHSGLQFNYLCNLCNLWIVLSLITQYQFYRQLLIIDVLNNYVFEMSSWLHFIIISNLRFLPTYTTSYGKPSKVKKVSAGRRIK